jgi:hypothetical protein
VWWQDVQERRDAWWRRPSEVAGRPCSNERPARRRSHVGSSPGRTGVESLKLSASFEWTDMSSSVNTLASSQSATVTVGGPAFGYAGPTDVLVYWDTVFNSWMFQFPTESPSVTGLVTDKHGKPVARHAVTLSGRSQAFTTFTNSKGQYRFYGTPEGKVKISVHEEDFLVDLGLNTTHAPVLELTRS